MNHSQSANQNATNGEQDAKTIITHKELTSAQKEQLIQQFVGIVVDNMDVKTMTQIVTDQLETFYDDSHIDFIKDEIDNYDEELYDELVDNVTNETFIDVNNNGGQF